MRKNELFVTGFTTSNLTSFNPRMNIPDECWRFENDKWACLYDSEDGLEAAWIDFFDSFEHLCRAHAMRPVDVQGCVRFTFYTSLNDIVASYRDSHANRLKAALEWDRWIKKLIQEARACV